MFALSAIIKAALNFQIIGYGKIPASIFEVRTMAFHRSFRTQFFPHPPTFSVWGNRPSRIADPSASVSILLPSW